jgi:beta-N-acetylhexosaminidase
MKGGLMMDVAGLALQPVEKEMLQHPLVDGVILFTRNYEEPDQVRALTTAIRRCKKTPIVIAVDQEGGRVQRFKAPLTRLPPVAHFGEIYDTTPELAVIQAQETGFLMASELRALGVDLSFAPVLDLNWGESQVIGDRAFHRDPAIVTILAGAFIQGMAQASMSSVGKHFPGHGWVKADSHVDLPVDTRDWETLWNYDLQPFRSLVAQGLDAVMPAHVVYAQCDSKPAGFSRFWLKEVLREKLNFKGLIYSDDLSMAGASKMGDFIDRAQAAFSAGCDKILVCNNPKGVVQILDGFRVLEKA